MRCKLWFCDKISRENVPGLEWTMSKIKKIKLNKYFSGYFALVIIFIILRRVICRGIWQQGRVRTRTLTWFFLWLWCHATQQGLISSRPDWSVVTSSSSSSPSPSSSITIIISSSISGMSSATASTTVRTNGTRIIGLPLVVLFEEWCLADFLWDDAAKGSQVKKKNGETKETKKLL